MQSIVLSVLLCFDLLNPYNNPETRIVIIIPVIPIFEEMEA